ncbi:hypothetical protein KZC52_15570 [Microbacterium sp. kSW2-24]|uniref:hypothetical protein n=1 Tax=Microbacterium galbinum TaxID=2851646 RepID=UPI001FFDC6AA|nr:hypothetical protein [Microbacterium galbinum]MCK2024351.1 hypothetical protein [Microbacterium galbinum]
MDLEITVTPRETLVWAPSATEAERLRRGLSDDGYLVLDAVPFELTEAGLIPEGEHSEFDSTRIFNVTTGPNANATLHALTDDGHRLIWHRLQTKRLARKVWGVTVAIPRKNQPRPGSTESATHFATTVRSTRGLGLRISRDTYATINKRVSTARWSRDDDPEFWDAVDWKYEDAEHRIHTDEWCEKHRERALANFDLNMAHFASLDRDEFEQALQEVVASNPGMVEVTDLAKWDGVGGLYIMVLDEYRQVYVGATNEWTGIAKRIRQHWTRQKHFDRLIWGDVESSILSIDSFRALDTTRIFALKSARSFESEDDLLKQFPAKYTLNRVMGGRNVARFATFAGLSYVMRLRDGDGAGEELDPS